MSKSLENLVMEQKVGGWTRLKDFFKSRFLPMMLMAAISYFAFGDGRRRIVGALGFGNDHGYFMIKVKDGKVYMKTEYGERSLDFACEQDIPYLVKVRREISRHLPGKALVQEINNEIRNMPEEYFDEETIARLTKYAADHNLFNEGGNSYLVRKFSENLKSNR